MDMNGSRLWSSEAPLALDASGLLLVMFILVIFILACSIFSHFRFSQEARAKASIYSTLSS